MFKFDLLWKYMIALGELKITFNSMVFVHMFLHEGHFIMAKIALSAVMPELLWVNLSVMGPNTAWSMVKLLAAWDTALPHVFDMLGTNMLCKFISWLKRQSTMAFCWFQKNIYLFSWGIRFFCTFPSWHLEHVGVQCLLPQHIVNHHPGTIEVYIV